jgi:SAM-dependent methyltransferase
MPTGERGADISRLQAAWADRVRANRDQVARIRRGPERDDFYAPVSAHFVSDPFRTDDEVVDELRRLARADDTWLDIGAGAGRYALPLALVVREVIALDPSPGMLAALRDAMGQHGIANVRVVQGRWPEAATTELRADVALIAQVGYDVEGIGPFLDAMEDAAGRLCVTVMMDRSPASAADGFWPAVHGMERVPLPALPELVELLRARGADPSTSWREREARAFATSDETLAYLRQQVWADAGDAVDGRLRAEIERRLLAGWDGLTMDSGPTKLAIVAWTPVRRQAQV